MATTDTLPLAPPRLARICLYGDLQRFGRRHALLAATAAEAVYALASQLPALRRQLLQGWYQVRLAGEDMTTETLAQRLHEPLPDRAVIHIVPRPAGAKSGFIQTILGAAFVAFAAWNPLGWSSAVIGGLVASGGGLALSGVAMMLTPTPKTPSLQRADNGKPNTYFSSLDNLVAQGNPVPVVYGEIMVGSRVISQEVSVWDEQGDVIVVGMR
ncbi:tail assembly protein [Edwardsiella tarda]|uniref:tail assembly protein n=1 Tax=Edwardsiella tarda TaxID=636 RepID=UPI003A88B1BC